MSGIERFLVVGFCGCEKLSSFLAQREVQEKQGVGGSQRDVESRKAALRFGFEFRLPGVIVFAVFAFAEVQAFLPIVRTHENSADSDGSKDALGGAIAFGECEDAGGWSVVA